MAAPGSGPGLLGYKIADLEGEHAFVESMSRIRHAVVDTRKELQLLTETSIKQDRDMSRGGARTMQQAVSRGSVPAGPGVGASVLARGAGMAAGLAATVGGTMLVRESIRAGIQDSKDVAKLSIIVKGSAGALAELGAQIDELGRKTGIDDNLIAKAAADAMEVGIAQADVMTLATAASRSAMVTQEGFADVMDATTNVLRTYNMEASNADRVNSILFKGVRGGADSYKALGDLIGQRGSALQSMGMGLSDTVATVATLGQGGFRGMRAVGSMQTLLDAIANPNKEALSAAKELGLVWDSDSVKAMGFGRWLDHVRERLEKTAAGGKSVTQSLSQLGISGMAQSGFLALINRSDEYNRILSDINSGHDTLGEAMDLRSQQADVLANRLAVLQDQSIEAFGVGALKGFIGAGGVGGGAESMADAIPQFTKAGEDMGEAARGLLDWLRENGTIAKWGIAGLAGAWTLNKAKPLLGMAKSAAGWLGDTASILWNGLPTAAGGGVPGLSMLGVPAGVMAGSVGAGFLGATLYSREAGAGSGLDAGERAGLYMDAVKRGRINFNAEAGQVFGEMFADALASATDQKTKDMIRESMRKFGDWYAGEHNAWLYGLRESTALALKAGGVDASKFTEFYGQSDPNDPKFMVSVKLDHTITDTGKDAAKRKHAGAARVAGAGKADINAAYRFSVVRHGEGVHEVLPMESNVVLGHIRRAQ